LGDDDDGYSHGLCCVVCVGGCGVVLLHWRGTCWSSNSHCVRLYEERTKKKKKNEDENKNFVI
jgi:hypothetical protein